MHEMQVPGCPGLVARYDGTLWLDGRQLVGTRNTSGYIVADYYGQKLHWAALIAKAFSPMRHRRKDVPEEERAQMRREAEHKTVREVALSHDVAYQTAWRIINEGV